MFDGKEKKARGYLYKDEVSWTHHGGLETRIEFRDGNDILWEFVDWDDTAEEV